MEVSGYVPGSTDTADVHVHYYALYATTRLLACEDAPTTTPTLCLASSLQLQNTRVRTLGLLCVELVARSRQDRRFPIRHLD